MFKYPFCRMGAVVTTASASLPFYVFQGGGQSRPESAAKFFETLQKRVTEILNARSIYDANIVFGTALSDAQNSINRGDWGPNDMVYFTTNLRPYFDQVVAALVGAPLVAAQNAAATAEAARIVAENARIAAETARAAAETAHADADAAATTAEARRLEAVADAEAARAAQAVAEANAAASQASAVAAQAAASQAASDAEVAAHAAIASRKKIGKMILAGAVITVGSSGLLLLSNLKR